MSILSGQSISQFNNFVQSNKILSNDHFITSQQLNVNLQNTNTYISKSLSYDKLVGQLFKDLSAAFGFKSMAYELSDQYSNINHTHNYNFFDKSGDLLTLRPDITSQIGRVIASTQVETPIKFPTPKFVARLK